MKLSEDERIVLAAINKLQTAVCETEFYKYEIERTAGLIEHSPYIEEFGIVTTLKRLILKGLVVQNIDSEECRVKFRLATPQEIVRKRLAEKY